MGMYRHRRACLAVLAGTMLGLAGIGGQAQAYPTKPIRVIVPSSPGGSPDTLARLIGPPLSEALGQPVVIETMPGAAGIIGTQRAAQAEPDGHTLLYGFNQIATMNPPLYKKLSYHPERDFVPLGLTLNLSYMWIANKDFPPNTIAELIELNKAKPGSVDYASTGPGSAAHLGALLLERMSGTKMSHIPYKSNTNSDLMAGIVKLKLDPVAASLGLVRGGNVKVLAVSAPERLAVLPDVPTVAETIPGYELTGWQGFWAPKGTPPEIVKTLNTAITKVIKAPAMQKRIRDLGFEPLGSTPEEMADRIHRELKQWADIIREENLSLDQ